MRICFTLLITKLHLNARLPLFIGNQGVECSFVRIQPNYVSTTNATQRPSGQNLRAHMNCGGHLTGRSAHASVGDDCYSVTFLLQAQHRGSQFVQLRMPLARGP